MPTDTERWKIILQLPQLLRETIRRIIDIDALNTLIKAKTDDINWSNITSILTATTTVVTDNLFDRVSTIQGWIDGVSATAPARTTDSATVQATETQADTTKIGYYLKPKLQAWADNLDAVLTLSPLALTASGKWSWLATLTNGIYNQGIKPLFEFLSDLIIAFFKYLIINFAQVANDVVDSLESWYQHFVDRFFFVATTVSTAGIARFINIFFDEVEDRTQQIGFTKFKPNLDFDDLPAGSINIYLPKFLLRQAFSDPSMKMFGQTSVKWWMVVLDVLALILFVLGLVFLPSKSGQLFKILFKVRTVLRKKQVFKPFEPSLLAKWQQLEQKSESQTIFEKSHTRYALD